MTSIGYYFHTPRRYAKHLGGVRWSRTGEVVEYPDEGTFAFRSEIALFLEGLVTNGRLIHFGFVLHLLHLLGVGKLALPGPAPALYAAFRKVGRPLRNAGAFCATLTRNVPAVPVDFDPEAVCRQLHSGAMMSILYVSWSNALPEEHGELPPLEPRAFEALVLRELAQYTLEEIEHWLRFGRGPVKGAEQLAGELEKLPRALGHVLANLAKRPRLVGAVPFVAQLVSALTLPPRRRTEQELPTGGYADVTTHGTPEHLLPSQFALDDLEFLRRFAENELLYFRREEPHARTEEELVLLLDQGVRTWGDVRLLLGAAVLALGRLAERRRMPLRVAATSSAGHWLDPLEAGEEELGELLDASDLTANPGLALECVLEEPVERARDVVLLTHPRNLAEEDVAAAARRAAPGTRLFALTAAPDGQVALHELKRGHPVLVSRFRVDPTQAAPPPPEPSPQADWRPWSGDVEPIPLPFRIGLVTQLDPHKFDFDHDGEWLVALSAKDWLYVWKLDGTRAEILPRGRWKGQYMTGVEAVFGVAGGCVLTGEIGLHLMVFHYQFAPRTCTATSLGISSESIIREWFYFREYHSVVVTEKTSGGTLAARSGLDLATGEVRSFHDRDACNSKRLLLAFSRVYRQRVPPPRMLVGQDLRWEPYVPCVNLDPHTGTLRLQGVEPEWQTFTPLADGKPALAGAVLGSEARCAAGTLALTTKPRGGEDSWMLRVFRGPEGTPLGEYYQPVAGAGFALSADGRLLARLRGAGLQQTNQLEVRDLARGVIGFTTPRGRCHPGYQFELGEMRLTLRIGKMSHVIGWKDGRLEVRFTRTAGPDLVDVSHAVGGVTGMKNEGKPWSQDPRRFVRGVRGEVTVLIDCFGHTAILNAADELVCLFFVFRERLAAWMPDGTRFGPEALTGGPETPGARERIGQALYRASQLGRGRQL